MASDTARVWLQLDLDGHLSPWWHLYEHVSQCTGGNTETEDRVAGTIQNLKIFDPAKYVKKKTVIRFPLDSDLKEWGGVGWGGVGWGGVGVVKGKEKCHCTQTFILHINTLTHKYLDPYILDKIYRPTTFFRKYIQINLQTGAHDFFRE